MVTYSLSAALALLISLLFTPLVRDFALRHRIVDAAGVSNRKIHAQDVARIGGIAIVAGFYLPLLGLTLIPTGVGRQFLDSPVVAYGLMGGGAVIAILGVVDDLRGVSARTKLAVQALAAVTVVAFGFKIPFVEVPGLPVIDGVLVYPLSVLWIIGVTNAVNLIDGMDGLAAGVAFFGLAPMAIVAVLNGNILMALVACTLAGSVLGFLFFNFHPAKIFMGDSGSMFLGFVLSLVTVKASEKNTMFVSMLAPILALGLPLMDTLLAIVRRALVGLPIFAGDRDHIHHRLLRAMGHRNAVLVMYGVSALLACGSLIVNITRNVATAPVLVVSLLISAILMRQLGYFRLGNLSSDLRRTSVERTRNREMHERMRAAMTLLQQSEPHAGVSTVVGKLVEIVDAGWAELQLVDVRAPGRVSTRTWWPRLDARPESALTFAVQAPHERRHGTLRVAWGPSVTLDHGLTSVVEHACVTLGNYLEVNVVETHPAVVSSLADVTTTEE